MNSAVHFGAGNIGRGFLGQLLFEAGFRTTFVDTNPALVRALQMAGSYPLRLVGADGVAQELKVENVTALFTGETDAVVTAVVHAQLLSTAVGVSALPKIAPLLAAGLNARVAADAAPINLLLCENGWHLAEVLRELLLPHLSPEARNNFHTHVGLVECVVGRMVPVPSAAVRQQNPLLVVAESYKELPINKKGLRGFMPLLPGLAAVDNFDAYEARKLFLHNMGHAALAYSGWQKGHEFIWQCVQDTSTASLCRRAMEEVQSGLVAEYELSQEALAAFAADLMQRFGSKALGDTVARVASDPLRKLSPADRLIGAARLCEKHHVPPRALARVIAAALYYHNPADPAAVALQKRRTVEGDAAVIESVCRLTPGSDLFDRVLAALSSQSAKETEQ